MKEPSLIPPLVEKMKSKRTYNCLSLDFYNITWSQMPLEELYKRQGLEFMSEETKRSWAQSVKDRYAALHAGSGGSVERKIEARRNYMRTKFDLLNMLADFGAPIVVSGANANDPFGVPGFCLWEEMKLFASAGIPNKEILRMATHGSAEYFSEERSWGSVAEGMKANLVLLDKNPT